MPHYLISITLKENKQVAGIRYYEKDIERAWQYFELKAKEKFGEQQIIDFRLYGLSKRSMEFREWQASKHVDDFTLDIPDVEEFTKPNTGRSRKESMQSQFGKE